MVSYKVNKEQGTVKCTLIDFYRGRVRKSVGWAKCSPEDTFDEEKGKKLAFYRARIQEIGRNIGNYIEAKTKLDRLYDLYTIQLDNKISSQREEIKRLRTAMYEGI